MAKSKYILTVDFADDADFKYNKRLRKLEERINYVRGKERSKDL